MIKQQYVLSIVIATIFVFFISNSAFAAGIMGPQAGDRSPKENDTWLKKSLELIRVAIKEAGAGNGEKSVENGYAALAAMREINSEGWAPKLESGAGAIRRGINSAKKGEFEQATSHYERAMKKFGSLKFGDLNWTHESFLGIGDRR